MNHRKLFIVFNRAMAKARKTGNDPKLIQRLKKAFSILQSKEYYQGEREQYHPTSTTCNCKDFEYWYSHKRAYKFHCKHMVSEIFLERMKNISYRQTDFMSMVK